MVNGVLDSEITLAFNAVRESLLSSGFCPFDYDISLDDTDVDIRYGIVRRVAVFFAISRDETIFGSAIVHIRFLQGARSRPIVCSCTLYDDYGDELNFEEVL